MHKIVKVKQIKFLKVFNYQKQSTKQIQSLRRKYRKLSINETGKR